LGSFAIDRRTGCRLWTAFKTRDGLRVRMEDTGKHATFDPMGIHVFDGGREVRTFPWGQGDWKVDLKDTRMPRELDSRDVTEQMPEGRPRITSLDPKARDQDRDLLGLPVDESSDPVLLINTKDIGTLSLHYGTLDVHSVPISDDLARQLILEAANRGFEVRRKMLTVSGKGGGVGRVGLVTSITTRKASETLEVER
jgi:hypothetical protein